MDMAWTAAAIAGRALLASLFLLAGVAKILTPKPFLDHMAEHRVPGVLLPLVIALELGGGLWMLSGWRAQWATLALAGFCVMTAVVFHLDWSDKAERTLCLKDLAIAGGLLVLAASYARGAAQG
jgi:putative oxidoreductase